MDDCIKRYKNYEEKKGNKQPQKSLGLGFIWKFRLKLMADGDKLMADGDKLRSDGYKLMADGDKLMADGDKLRSDGYKLMADAILEVYGNIKLEWKNYNPEKNDYECHLENGEVYGFDD